MKLSFIGCLLHGCCLGVACPPHWWTLRDAAGTSRWPAVPAEMFFNMAAVAAILFLQRRGRFVGQRFHLYLIGYGLFRFVHEPLRATPRVVAGLSGYQIIALGVALLGVVGFIRRRAETASRGSTGNAL